MPRILHTRCHNKPKLSQTLSLDRILIIFKFLDELQSGSTEKDILPIGDVTKWSVNLATLPSVESCDVMVYLLNDCGWEASRLTSYRKDNGYKLHRDNHIIM